MHSSGTTIAIIYLPSTILYLILRQSYSNFLLPKLNHLKFLACQMFQKVLL